MTPKEVDKLASDANLGLRNQPGYVNTTVHSYGPVILAHHFNNYRDSHAFAMYLIAPKDIRYSIDPADACTVLERRTEG